MKEVAKLQIKDRTELFQVTAIRFDFGPLAEWLPSHETSIIPFAAEKYPDIFYKNILRF